MGTDKTTPHGFDGRKAKAIVLATSRLLQGLSVAAAENAARGRLEEASVALRAATEASGAAARAASGGPDAHARGHEQQDPLAVLFGALRVLEEETLDAKKRGLLVLYEELGFALGLALAALRDGGMEFSGWDAPSA